MLQKSQPEIGAVFETFKALWSCHELGVNQQCIPPLSKFTDTVGELRRMYAKQVRGVDIPDYFNSNSSNDFIFLFHFFPVLDGLVASSSTILART